MKNISAVKGYVSKGLSFIIALVVTQAASAAIVAQGLPKADSAQSSASVWDFKKKTHVIVASKGLMFAAVGYHQANLFSKLYPEEQILFISNLPSTPAYQFTKQKQLKKQGFQIIEESALAITSEYFIASVLKNTSNIKTLTIISHNGVEKGPWLEDGDRRLDFKNEKLMGQLRPAFNPDAWVRIQGCNSGWNVARYLSGYWNVPVIGSFTSSSFYYLTEAGNYELYSSVEEINAGGISSAAKKDIWSLSGSIHAQGDQIENGQNQSIDCPEGICFTLIPESAPYHMNIHKSPEAAWLPMTKPICAPSVSDERCQMALAESLIAGVGTESRVGAKTNPQIFRSIVLQSICGSYANAKSQKACTENLEAAYQARKLYFPYRHGKMLNCSVLRACAFDQVSIDLRKNKSEEPITDTINNYIDQAMRGHELRFN